METNGLEKLFSPLLMEYLCIPLVWGFSALQVILLDDQFRVLRRKTSSGSYDFTQSQHCLPGGRDPISQDCPTATANASCDQSCHLGVILTSCKLEIITALSLGLIIH